MQKQERLIPKFCSPFPEALNGKIPVGLGIAYFEVLNNFPIIN
jgi:hypothetical protein